MPLSVERLFALGQLFLAFFNQQRHARNCSRPREATSVLQLFALDVDLFAHRDQVRKLVGEHARAHDAFAAELRP